MIEHPYVQHPVFATRDQCEHKYDDDGRVGFCGRPRSEHMDEVRALKIQVATALQDLAGTQEALLALRVDYQRAATERDALRGEVKRLREALRKLDPLDASVLHAATEGRQSIDWGNVAKWMQEQARAALAGEGT